MAKQKASKQKKMNVRVDFTPMVDMMMSKKIKKTMMIIKKRSFLWMLM